MIISLRTDKKKKKFLKEPYKNFLFCNIRRAFRIQLSKFRHNNTLITGTKIHLRSHVDSFSILVWTVHAPKSVNTRECIPYFVCQIIDEISNFTEISTVYGPLEIRYVTNSPQSEKWLQDSLFFSWNALKVHQVKHLLSQSRLHNVYAMCT